MAEGTAFDDHDRQNSLLTKAYRQALVQGDPTSVQLTRMRERVEHGLMDFRLLSEHLDWDSREYLFGDNIRRFSRPDLNETVSDIIEFLFLAQTRRRDDWEYDSDGYHNPQFEAQLEQGLRSAYLKHDLILEDMDLDIDSRPNPDPERVRQIIESGIPIPAWVLEVAHERGWVDKDDHRDFLIDQIEANSSD